MSANQDRQFLTASWLRAVRAKLRPGKTIDTITSQSEHEVVEPRSVPPLLRLPYEIRYDIYFRCLRASLDDGDVASEPHDSKSALEKYIKRQKPSEYCLDLLAVNSQIRYEVYSLIIPQIMLHVSDANHFTKIYLPGLPVDHIRHVRFLSLHWIRENGTGQNLALDRARRDLRSLTAALTSCDQLASNIQRIKLAAWDSALSKKKESSLDKIIFEGFPTILRALQCASTDEEHKFLVQPQLSLQHPISMLSVRKVPVYLWTWIEHENFRKREGIRPRDLSEFPELCPSCSAVLSTFGMMTDSNYIDHSRGLSSLHAFLCHFASAQLYRYCNAWNGHQSRWLPQYKYLPGERAMMRLMLNYGRGPD